MMTTVQATPEPAVREARRQFVGMHRSPTRDYRSLRTAIRQQMPSVSTGTTIICKSQEWRHSYPNDRDQGHGGIFPAMNRGDEIMMHQMMGLRLARG